MVVDIEHGKLGAVRQAGIPVKLSDTPGSVDKAPPALGEHTDEVLKSLGYKPEEIGQMHSNGVI
jgi:crotonobetainyl-CoA:carnitine CoA-transferase CaiB-like acyl-CoA transferase